MPAPAGGRYANSQRGRWNKAGLNRLTKHLAPWVPGFGVVAHRGRRSGRRYLTPVNVFAAEDGYVFALAYGPGTDWVKNVLAAGGCELQARGFGQVHQAAAALAETEGSTKRTATATGR